MGRVRPSAARDHRASLRPSPAGSVAVTATGAALLVLPSVTVDGFVGPYVDAKAFLLVALAAAAGVAWLAAGPLRPSGVRHDRLTRLLQGAVLAYVGWMAVATATSIAPGLSLWGDWGRAQGLATIAAAIALGAVVWTPSRGAERADPLVELALLGSLPVVLFALGQAAGWNPLPQTQRDPATAGLQVRSTLGLHIFLGSYLALLAPVTLARLACIPRRGALTGADRGAGPGATALTLGLLWTVGAVGLSALAATWPPAAWGVLPLGIVVATIWTRGSWRGSWLASPTATAGGLAGLLLCQVLVVLLTRARGPFLGLLTGLSIAGLGILALRRALGSLAVAAGVLAAVAAFLVLLNWPGSPLAPLRDLPALSRLARLTETQPSSPGGVRLHVWYGIAAGWGRQLTGEPVLPGSAAIPRSLVGYGPETQATTIERLAWPRADMRRTAGERRIRYFVDRAHNDPLDHLLSGGLVALGLWVTVAGLVLTVGFLRILHSPPGTDQILRLGALGAVAGHLLEAQFGIGTPVSRVLFAVTVGVLTRPLAGGSPSAPGPARPLPRLATLGAGVAAGLVVAGSTGWLLASAAYATGSRAWAAGDAPAAHRAFTRAQDLAPWLAQPGEALAEVTLSLTAAEPDPRRRLELLHGAERALARARRAAHPGADHWLLVGQVAHTQAMAGVPDRLAVAVDAYSEAARLRMQDAGVHALRAFALIEAGRPQAAREAAERAIAIQPGAWLQWAVLARSARELGDQQRARLATARARALAPPGAHALLHRLVPLD